MACPGQIIHGDRQRTLTDIDLYVIINELSSGLPESVPHGLFNMIGHVCFVMADKYYALHRKSMSIRDVLNMVNWIKNSNLPVHEAFHHAVELVIIDGVCLGIDVAGSETIAILQDCRDFLAVVISEFFGCQAEVLQGELVRTDRAIGVEPFVMQKVPGRS